MFPVAGRLIPGRAVREILHAAGTDLVSAAAGLVSALFSGSYGAYYRSARRTAMRSWMVAR